MSEWTVNGKTSPARPGMFILTSTHYSIFHVNRPEPRAKPAQTGAGGMTDVEKVVAFDEITANSGRDVIEGDLLTTRAFIAKEPAYMALWPDNEQEYTVRRDGNASHHAGAIADERRRRTVRAGAHDHGVALASAHPHRMMQSRSSSFASRMLPKKIDQTPSASSSRPMA